jgi:hypothetical protein
MIAVEKGKYSMIIKYLSVNGHAFTLGYIRKNVAAKEYRILEKYVPEGVYKNEILDMLASLFAINTRDEKLVDMVLEGSKAEIAKLRLRELTPENAG